jgi:hypothetical protein
MHRRWVSFAWTLLTLTVPAAAAGQEPASLSAQDLKRLSIEELAEIDVTSVSRRAERLSETAAAVSVIRADDIRRSGYTTLADAMRLADGLDVARVNSSTWGVSARGFNTNPANKLLVLIDGRTVYSPLFSGTFWDSQELILADVDRIEVIRGPGGSMWGANAVNGVINVIMKDAAETRGTLAVLSTGSCWYPARTPTTRSRWGWRESASSRPTTRRRGGFCRATSTAARRAFPIGRMATPPAAASWAAGRGGSRRRRSSSCSPRSTAPTGRSRCSSRKPATASTWTCSTPRRSEAVIA